MGRPITPRILSRELKELEHRGLINRKAYPVVPRRVEYSLTDRGRALLPILSEIIRWGATGAHEEILGIASSMPIDSPGPSPNHQTRRSPVFLRRHVEALGGKVGVMTVRSRGWTGY